MRRFLKFRLRTALVLMTLVAVGLVVKLRWDQWRRVKTTAELWVASVSLLNAQANRPRSTVCPIEMSALEQRRVLRYAILNLKTRSQRIAAVLILVERFPLQAVAVMKDIVHRQRDPRVTALMLRLIGLRRVRGDLPLLRRYLRHDHPRCRAAAVEALGMIRRPSYPLPWSHDTRLNCDPPVDYSHVMQRSLADSGRLDGRLYPVSPRLRDEAQRLLLGKTPLEREAAARVLVSWPPDEYRLRVAEWGVWLSDNGRLDLIEEVLDEIPSFVHRTGDDLRDLKSRFPPQLMFVTKPVVHITVDRPLAMDLTVFLTQGRPWFAYPRPDDFVLRTQELRGTMRNVNRGMQLLQRTDFPQLTGFDRSRHGTLVDAREGYPWQVEKHGTSTPDDVLWAPSYREIVSVGLRWQSLIATPDRHDWMRLPSPDDKHAWWTALRKVPSSWLTSRGETERFLYYDGPTRAKSPLQVTFRDGQLEFVHRKMLEAAVDDLPLAPSESQTGPDVVRKGLFLDVADDGRLTGRGLTIRANTRRLDPQASEPYDREAGRQFLLRALVDYGLTAAEAEGLVVSWQRRFFHTPGRRLLMLLSPDEYDMICPITIRPAPTELIRVGLILTEFTEEPEG